MTPRASCQGDVQDPCGNHLTEMFRRHSCSKKRVWKSGLPRTHPLLKHLSRKTDPRFTSLLLKKYLLWEKTQGEVGQEA